MFLHAWEGRGGGGTLGRPLSPVGIRPRMEATTAVPTGSARPHPWAEYAVDLTACDAHAVGEYLWAKLTDVYLPRAQRLQCLMLHDRGESVTGRPNEWPNFRPSLEYQTADGERHLHRATCTRERDWNGHLSGLTVAGPPHFIESDESAKAYIDRLYRTVGYEPAVILGTLVYQAWDFQDPGARTFSFDLIKEFLEWAPEALPPLVDDQ